MDDVAQCPHPNLFNEQVRAVASIQIIVTCVVSLGLQIIFIVVIGSIYMSSFIAFEILTISLTIHRFIYTLLPFVAPKLLSAAILKGFLTILFIFISIFFAIQITPVMGVLFCPVSMMRIYVDGPGQKILEW
uniref:Aa_trans domain-containing protein n=1 Tax=Heterorhabditis bacteriophora TaxID=37862 RepID=A0A1I7WQE3_HETBA